MSIEKIFISYAHKDEEYCKKVCDFLNKYELPYWQDADGLPPSAEDFNEIIEEAIDDCKYFICVWTEHIKNSQYCKQELERAFEWKKREPERRIYVFKMDEHLDDLNDMPKGINIQLNGKNILYTYNDDALKKAIEQISNQLNHNFQSGMSKEQVVRELLEYVSKKTNATEKLSTDKSKVVNKKDKEYDKDEISQLLVDGENVFLCGERGCGRTTFILNVYLSLLTGLKNAIEKKMKDYMCQYMLS